MSDVKMDTQAEHRDRLTKMEVELTHVVDTVDDLSERLHNHEIETAKGIGDLNERVLRLQIATENLVREAVLHRSEDREYHIGELAKIDGLSTRVTKLEQWRWYLLGAGLTIVFIAEGTFRYFGK